MYPTDLTYILKHKVFQNSLTEKDKFLWWVSLFNKLIRTLLFILFFKQIVFKNNKI